MPWVRAVFKVHVASDPYVRSMTELLGRSGCMLRCEAGTSLLRRAPTGHVASPFPSIHRARLAERADRFPSSAPGAPVFSCLLLHACHCFMMCSTRSRRRTSLSRNPVRPVCNLHRVACVQGATCITQNAASKVQRALCNTPRTACHTQRAPTNVQTYPCSKQRTACDNAARSAQPKHAGSGSGGPPVGATGPYVGRPSGLKPVSSPFQLAVLLAALPSDYALALHLRLSPSRATVLPTRAPRAPLSLRQPQPCALAVYVESGGSDSVRGSLPSVPTPRPGVCAASSAHAGGAVLQRRRCARWRCNV